MRKEIFEPWLDQSASIEGPILVTGACGCIGSWVLWFLSRAGVEAIGSDMTVHRKRLSLLMGDDAKKLTIEACDITDADALRELITRYNIQAIIHLAGLQIPFCAAEPALGARVNLEGTINIFEAARDAGINRLVYASSVAAHGISDQNDFKETLYGVYKRASEQAASIFWRDHALPSIALRPNIVYGLGRDQGMSSKTTLAIQAASLGLDYEVPFTGRQSWLYAGEAAAAFIQSVKESGEGAHVFDLNGPCHTVEEGLTILRAYAPEVTLTCIGDPFPFPPDLSDAPLRKHIGDYPNISIKEGIAETFLAFQTLIMKERMPDLPD